MRMLDKKLCWTRKLTIWSDIGASVSASAAMVTIEKERLALIERISSTANHLAANTYSVTRDKFGIKVYRQLDLLDVISFQVLLAAVIEEKLDTHSE